MIEDPPLRLTLGGYTVDISRRVDGGVTLTVYVMFGRQTIEVPAAEWQQIVGYAPPPQD